MYAGRFMRGDDTLSILVVNIILIHSVVLMWYDTFGIVSALKELVGNQ